MPRRLVERLRRDERGFTLIELLIAAGLCMVGLMAVMSTFDGSRGLVSEAERNEVASHRAQRALEDAVSRPYEELGLQGTGAPASSTDPYHPNNRITTTGTYLFRTGRPAANFVVGGTLPHSTPWSDDATRLSGTIYRYVTEYHDDSLEPGGTTVHGKRVTVAVTVKDRRRAVTTSTIVREAP